MVHRVDDRFLDRHSRKVPEALRLGTRRLASRIRSVEVLRLDGDSYRLVNTYGEAECVRIEPFEAIELELQALWPAPRTEE